MVAATEAQTPATPAPSGTLSSSDVDRVFDEAGVPLAWRADMKTISFCESQWHPAAVGDSGNSVGLFQLWRGWFPSFGFDPNGWSDPVTNARVAVLVRQQRGRYGGGGGWSCADINGIP